LTSVKNGTIIKLMKKLLIFLLTPLKENTAFAHCDIPCGIYDPYVIQRAAHTILRMTQLLTDLKTEDPKKMAHDIARMTHVKEEHAELLEEELETLRNDYFKEEHFTTYANLNELFTKTLKAASKARQEINLEVANEVLAGTQEIAEIFFKTKNVESVRVKSVYPTGGEIVLHK
jgi:nickel superoxide dismutase